MEKVLSDKDIREITSRSKRMWELEFYCACADCPNAAETKIFFDPTGEMSYQDPNENRIVIGLKGAVDMWEISDEKLLHAAVRTLRIHETGHLRYTAMEPTAWGLKRGTELIVEHIAKTIGSTTKFRKPSDYDWFLQKELAAKGIMLSFNTLFKLLHHVWNSLEDGRIERILTNAYPGFEQLRLHFRGILWKNNLCAITPAETATDPGKRLNIVLGELLSLSTMHVHLKGFEKNFKGTDEYRLVQSMMIHVFNGITAPTTRIMVEKGFLPICEKLAPLFYEVCAVSKSDIDKALEKFIRDMIKNAIDKMDENTGTSEKNAETDDSPMTPAFPKSDLEVTLDDETYDKLMEKLKDKGKGEGGITVKREHPKEEPEPPESDESSEKDGSSSRGSEKESENEPKNGSKPGGESKPNVDEEPGEPKGSGKPQSSTEQNTGKTGGSEDEPDEPKRGDGILENRKEDDSIPDGNKEEGGTCSPSSAKQHGPAQQKERVKPSNDFDADALEAEIEKAMLEAAEKVEADAEVLLDSINQSVQAATLQNRDVSESPRQPLSASDVKDVCPKNFIEVFRKYDLSAVLPADIEAIGRTAHAAYEQWARNKRKPVARFRKEGRIDPRNVHRLSMNKVDVFLKEAKADEFDGCAYILIDNSGSMDGAKRMAACRAAAIQEEAFRGLFPFKIVAFDYGSAGNAHGVIHEVVKDWNESHHENLCWNFALKGRHGNGNCDEHDIRIATKELLEHRGRKKMLIVLSDGAPDDTADTRRAIREARKKGISVFGIYFEEGNVVREADYFREMYEKDYVCCPLPDIEKHLSTLLSRFFKS